MPAKRGRTATMTKDATKSTAPPPHAARVEDVVCLRCGCLCDDLAMATDAGRIVEVKNACPAAREWFLAERGDEAPAPAAMVQGRPVPVHEAIEAAAALLADARRPLFDGFVHLTCEAQRVAVDVAERVGGLIVGTASAAQARAMDAWVAGGAVAATFGEVRNRADLVLIWNADPVRTHPRFLERFVLTPTSRFLPKGREDRTLIVLGDASSETAALADYVVESPPDRAFAVAWTLRGLLREAPLDPDAVARATGAPLETWSELAATLKRARYGAVLHDPAACGAREVEATTWGIAQLVDDLNDHTAFVDVVLGAGGNAAGAEQTLAWKSGACGCVDFASGRPTRRRDLSTARQAVARGEVDAAVFFHCDPLGEWSAEEWQGLGRVPTVVLASRASATRESASVYIRTAEVGRSAAGTVFRSDGVALPLRPIEPTDAPADAEVLLGLLERLARRADAAADATTD